MKALKSLQYILLTSMLLLPVGNTKDYIVYGVSQELPMGEPGERVKKNYYINIGKEQGIVDDTVLNVFRPISRPDPYEAKKRYRYEIKVGEVRVVYVDDESSVAVLKSIANKDDDPLLEIPAIMVGDRIKIKVN